MSRPVDLTDPENPEWTDEMFAQARPIEAVLPADALAAFPRIAARVRGPQKAPTKTAVSIRLDTDVVEHFRRSGPGWQSRLNETLRRAMG